MTDAESSTLEQLVGKWSSSIGVDPRGLALAWLPPAAPLWAVARLGPRNRLPPTSSKLKPDELLTDDELELEFQNILNSEGNAIHITIDEDELEEDRQRVEDLKEQIEFIKHERGVLEKNKNTALSLDLEFNRELEYYKRVKTERLQKLADATETYDKLTVELNNEKNRLNDTLMEKMHDFIQDGKMFENQINDNQLKEYFDANEYIYSYFKFYLKQRHEENYGRDDDDDSNFYNIDTVIHSSKKVEDAIWNYIQIKAELNKSKECFKFHLQYNNDNNLFSKNNVIQRDFNYMKTMENEKDSFHIIRSFVKNQIGLVLYEELKLRVMKIGILHEELDVILNKICTVNTCSELLISSLQTREEIKNKIINLFYSMAKFIISDMENIQNKKKMISDKSKMGVKSDLINEIDLIKDTICNIFHLSNDIDLKDALKVADSSFEDMEKMNNVKLGHHFEEFLTLCDKNKRKCKVIKDFIWDGCAFQPNICNKGTEMAVYKTEKQNLINMDKIKNATNKFIQLKTSFELGSSTIK